MELEDGQRVQYHSEWKSHGLSASKKGATYAHCDITCYIDFSIANGGLCV